MRAKTPLFIVDLPLKVDPRQEKILLKRMDAARQLYNACLSEALRRLNLTRESKAYQKTRAMPKGKPKSRQSRERRRRFKELDIQFRFREFDLHGFAVTTKNNCWIGDLLDVHVCQKVATRAFKAVEQYKYGKRGRPRFKGFNRFNSVEGKSNESGIRWRDGQVVWSKLNLPAIFDPKDVHGLQAHGLSHKTKYVRLVRRKINGRNRFHVQLVQKGKSLVKKKNQVRDGVVGLDLGPSSIAAVSDTDAFLSKHAVKPRHFRSGI